MSELSEQDELQTTAKLDSDVVTVVSRSAYSGGNRSELIISRAWAMPSMHTFTVKPIGELVRKYVGDGKMWVDPFAGDNSPACWSNDLNPKKMAEYHMPATDFAKMLEGEYDGVLFDPPYNLQQLKECYESIGIQMFQDDSQRFPQNVKELLAPKVRMGGRVICCGWNTQGFGKNLGFRLEEILIVAHGRSHNDTLVTVERKVHHQERLPL